MINLTTTTRMRCEISYSYLFPHENSKKRKQAKQYGSEMMPSCKHPIKETNSTIIINYLYKN
jgi:hypothetical protein